jgi:hypothetical protein
VDPDPDPRRPKQPNKGTFFEVPYFEELCILSGDLNQVLQLKLFSLLAFKVNIPGGCFKKRTSNSTPLRLKKIF